jgi:hypothetical protein
MPQRLWSFRGIRTFYFIVGFTMFVATGKVLSMFSPLHSVCLIDYLSRIRHLLLSRRSDTIHQSEVPNLFKYFIPSPSLYSNPFYNWNTFRQRLCHEREGVRYREGGGILQDNLFVDQSTVGRRRSPGFHREGECGTAGRRQCFSGILHCCCCLH